MKIEAKDEAGMREEKVPTPNSLEELSAYIASLLEVHKDYGTCVYMMSMAATAAFNFAARQVGASGFQASCADLDVLRRTRSLPGPAVLIDISNALYPQYNLQRQLRDSMDKAKDWLREEAKKKLAGDLTHTSSAVVAHWRMLAEGE